MRRPAFLVSMALLASACGGPKVPLQIVGKAVPVNVKFAEGPPVITVRPAPGGYIIVPEQIPPEPLSPFMFPPPPPPRKPVLCPKASPYAQPALAAAPEIGDVPKGALYSFLWSHKLGNARMGDPFIEQRQVGNIQSNTDDVTGVRTFAFEVTTSNPYEASVTRFVVDDRQLAISGIQWITRSKRTTFAPATPVEILPNPVQQMLITTNPNPTWKSVGADPDSKINLSLDGALKNEQRIDACGSIVDTWLAELQLHWVSVDTDYTEIWRINVATQYGGLIVAETSIRNGTRDGLPLNDARVSKIMSVPES